MKTKLPIALIAVILAFAGCSAPEKGPVPVPDPRTLTGEGREWWDIYSVEIEGDKRIRTRVGYLYRKYDNHNPKGFYWVRDLAMNDVGFLLADYQAFLIKPARVPDGKPESQPLGIADLNLGVKKILQAPGVIEIEKVLPKPSTGQFAAPGSAKATPPPAPGTK